jgi:thiamine-phosphate pyrophosphorylase
MLLYAITDRTQLLPHAMGAPSLTSAKRTSRVGEITTLVSLARTWAQHNIDYIQIREKDLAPELLELTTKIVTAVRSASTHTRVLLNGPAQIALEGGADGIHLPANSPSNAAAEARSLFAASGRDAILSHACHSLEEIQRIKDQVRDATTANTLILYAPVFEKSIPGENPFPGLGLESLRAAAEAAQPIPVLALGGVTLQNASSCLTAGAAGIAAIRLFLNDDWPSMNSAHL